MMIKIFLGDSVVKNLLTNVGESARDMGSISRSEDSLEEEMATCSSILAWKIPRTEEPEATVHGVSKESETTEYTHI